MVESPKAIAILHPPKLRRFPMPQLIRVIDDFTSFQQEEEASPFPAMSDVGNVALHTDNGVNAALFSGGRNGCFSSNYSPQFIPNPPSYSSQTQTQTLDNTWYLNATEPPTAGLIGAPSQFPAPEGNVHAEDTLPSLVSGSEDIDEVSDMEEMRSFYRQPEKKHRLTADQVRRLETSFDVDNKLEPHRKSRLAKELGLEPKQVAIWFQNRRARFKSKRLEKDYYKLKANYDSLKAGYDSLLKERERLQNVVSMLSNEPRMRDTPRSNPGSVTGSMGSVHLKEYALTGRMVMAPGFGQGGAGSMRSGVIDYESPRSVDWNKQVVGPGLASAGYENPLRGPGAPPMGSDFGYVQPEGHDFGSAFGENFEFVPPGMDDQYAYWPHGLKF